MSRFEVHARLVEDAAFLAARRRADSGDPGPADWLRRVLERGYRLPPGEARDRRFARAHDALFRRLGLHATLERILRAHPGLAAADGPVRFGPEGRRSAEGMDLFVRRGPGGRDVRSVVAGISPATLADPAALARLLHREARKVEDLLDPSFGWTSGGDEGTAARRETVRLRYGAAWDAWADGRLARLGLPVPVPEEEGRTRFLRAFGGVLDEGRAGRAWRRLRAAGRIPHERLLAFSRDPAACFRSGGVEATAAPERRGPATGSPCPFCRFPTYDWERAPEALSAGMLAAAHACLPGWVPEDGVCGQCAMLLATPATGAAVAGAA